MANKNRMMPKATLKLRKIGGKYMIVETSDSCVNLTNVYSLNETAALLWEMLCRKNWRRNCAKRMKWNTNGLCMMWKASWQSGKRWGCYDAFF